MTSLKGNRSPLLRAGLSPSGGRYSVFEHTPDKFHFIKGDYIPEGPPPQRKIDQGFKRGPFKFDADLAESLYLFSREAYLKYDDLRYVIVPDYFIDIVGNELKRYLCAIQAYLDSPNSILTAEFLIQGLKDNYFALYLKRLRHRAFLFSQGLHILGDDPDWFKDTTIFSIKDIGAIFNFNYCFFWEETIDDEDWKKGLIPLAQPSVEDELKFKDTLRRLIPERIFKVDSREVLLENSSSSCLSKNGSMSKIYKEKEICNYYSCEPLRGKRCRIPVGPANYRDTVILSLPHSNTVKLIDRQCWEIASRMRNSGYKKDPLEINKLVRRLEEILSLYRSRYRERRYNKTSIPH